MSRRREPHLVFRDGEDSEDEEAADNYGLGPLVEDTAGQEVGEFRVHEEEDLMELWDRERGYQFGDGQEDAVEDLVEEEVAAERRRVEVRGVGTHA